MALDSVTYWLILGLVLLIAELLTGSFVLVFLALGAFAAGLSAALLGSTPSLTVQTGVFAVVVVVGIFGLRRPLQKRVQRNLSQMGSDVGQTFVADQTIAAKQTGRITYQGTGWQAQNVGDVMIAADDRVLIVAVDGNTLMIRKDP